jgi:isoquinoline 1-oxidoreductase beta subunit
LADRASLDPLEYRRRLLAHDSRALQVLNTDAERARWNEPPAAGRVRGLAFAKAFRTLIAQVAEVSISGSSLKIHRVVTAIDCGDALDPDHVSNLVEGGIAWGLSAALMSEITFADGRTVPSNFHDFASA